MNGKNPVDEDYDVAIGTKCVRHSGLFIGSITIWGEVDKHAVVVRKCGFDNGGIGIELVAVVGAIHLILDAHDEIPKDDQEVDVKPFPPYLDVIVVQLFDTDLIKVFPLRSRSHVTQEAIQKELTQTVTSIRVKEPTQKVGMSDLRSTDPEYGEDVRCFETNLDPFEIVIIQQRPVPVQNLGPWVGHASNRPYEASANLPKFCFAVLEFNSDVIPGPFHSNGLACSQRTFETTVDPPEFAPAVVQDQGNVCFLIVHVGIDHMGRSDRTFKAAVVPAQFELASVDFEDHLGGFVKAMY